MSNGIKKMKARRELREKAYKQMEKDYIAHNKPRPKASLVAASVILALK